MLFKERPEAFGTFQVRADLGASRFGPVYLGRDPSTRTRVVIRTFVPDVWRGSADEDDLLDSFRRLCSSNLDHPNIARPMTFGVEGSLPYVVYAYAQGTPMNVVMKQEGPRSVPEVLQRLGHLTAAVDYASDAGVQHGMLAPCDVIFEPDQTVVTGFGLAQALLRIGVSVEAVAPYASPQRSAGGLPSKPDDIYSLAALTIELLIGTPVDPAQDTSRALREAQGLPERRRIPRPAPHETRLFTTIPGVDAGRLRACFAAAFADDAGERPATGAEFMTSFQNAFTDRRDVDLETDASLAVAFPAEEESAKPANKPVVKPVEQVPAAKPVEKVAAAKPVEKVAAAKPADKIAEKAADRPADKFAERAAVVPVAQPVVMPVPKSAAKAVESTAKAVAPKAVAKVEDARTGPVLRVSHPPRAAAPVEGPLRQEPAERKSHAPLISEPELRFSHHEPVVDALPLDVHPSLATLLPGSGLPYSPARGRGFVTVVVVLLSVAAGFAGGFFAGRRSTPAASLESTAAPAGDSDDPVVASNNPPRSDGASAPDARTEVSAPEPRVSETPAPVATPAQPAPSLPAPAPAAAPETPTGRVLVRSSPAGAVVLIDGQSRGVTPLALRDLALADHLIEISYPGHNSRQQRVRLTESRPARSIDVTLQKIGASNASAQTSIAAEGPGSLQIASRPTGAQVFVDDNLVGTTPLLLSSVSSGAHRLRLELPGFQTWNTSVQIEGGERFRVSASLER